MKHPPQEEDLVSGRGIRVAGGGIVVATIGCALFAYALATCRTNDLGAGAARLERQTEVNGMERSTFEAEAQGLEANRRASEFLSRYGWVDRERQIVHVPIDTAIELYLERRRATRLDARAGDRK